LVAIIVLAVGVNIIFSTWFTWVFLPIRFE